MAVVKWWMLISLTCSFITVYGDTLLKNAWTLLVYFSTTNQLRISEKDRKKISHHAGFVLKAACLLVVRWSKVAAAGYRQRVCSTASSLLLSPPTCSNWRACSLTGLWGPIGSDSLRRGRPDGSEWQGDCAGLPPLLLDASSSVSVSNPRLLSRVCVFGRTTSSAPAGENLNTNRTLIINAKVMLKVLQWKSAKKNVQEVFRRFWSSE